MGGETTKLRVSGEITFTAKMSMLRSISEPIALKDDTLLSLID